MRLPRQDLEAKLEKPQSEYLNDILGLPFDVLNEGFIRVVDYMGNDSSVVNSARVSYGKGTKKLNEDRGLIRYLLRHEHMTPFEMCEIKFHVKCPIFVARQWLRHRTANVNEYSGRYSIMSDSFYVPDTENIQPQSKDNKQGRSGELSERNKEGVTWLLHTVHETSYNVYRTLLGEKFEDQEYEPYHTSELLGEPLLENDFQGIAREIARNVLPVSNYTQFYFKIDLRNLLNFVRLRNDPHAQYEIREYAKVISHIISQWCPLVYEAFEDYSVQSETFSKIELQILSDLCMNKENLLTIHENKYGISKGEFNEFLKKVNEKNLFQEKM